MLKKIPKNGIDDDCDGEIDEFLETTDDLGGKEEEGSNGCTCSSSSEPPWSSMGLWAVFGLMLGRRTRR